MFRAPTKKRKKTITRLRTDDSDDDENSNDGGDGDAVRKDQRSKKKRRLDDDNEDDDPLPSTGKSTKIKSTKKDKQTKKKKKKGLVVMSFDTREEEDGIDDKEFRTKYKKKHKRKGLGFGGSSMMMMEGEQEEEEEGGAASTAEPSSTISYGKEALEELKSKQSFKKSVITEENPTNNDEMNMSPPYQQKQQIHDSKNNTETNHLNEDFIPLKKKDGDSMILTGDEAHLFESQMAKDTKQQQLEDKKEEHLDTVMEDASPFLHHDNIQQRQQQAEESSAWEAEITRRAGLLNKSNQQNAAASSLPTTRSGPLNTNNDGDGGTSVLAMSKLRKQLHSTIDQLKIQNDDMKQAAKRREVELAQTKEEYDRQEKDVQDAGKALDYYQQLREQLACWVGALRDLQSKVQPIQDALIDLDSDFADTTPWRDWEDDMCSILHQKGYLDRVLGRQPDPAVFEDAVTVVDEFGRDVKSQQAMHRDKRMRKRKELRLQSHGKQHPSREDDTDAYLSDNEVGELEQRRTALEKALEVAIEGLEDEYTHLSNLVQLFRQWESAYPEEYKQCFANLSLADLASVLVQVDFCKTNTNGSNSKNVCWMGGLESNAPNGDGDGMDGRFEWVSALEVNQSNDKKSASSSSEVLTRVVEKVFLPALTTVLDKSAYNLLSKRQSRTLSAVYVRLQNLLQGPGRQQAPHRGFSELTKRLVRYIKSSLDDLAIIIINKDGIAFWDKDSNKDSDENQGDPNKEEEIRDVFRGATMGQLHRLSKMIRNVLLYWTPHLPQEGDGPEVPLVEFLLDFLSSKFLFLLSSLRNQQLSQLTSDIFSEIWNVLKEAKWLDHPDRMLHAAPLRAAAVAFNVQ